MFKIFAIPLIGFSTIQIIKFIKLPFFYEVLLTLLLCIPYFPPEKREIGTQTGMDIDTDNQKSLLQIIKLFLKSILKLLFK